MGRRVTLALTLALGACTCPRGGAGSGGGGGGGGLVGLQGNGQAQSLDFGEVAVGQSKTQTLSISNPGTASLLFKGLLLSGTDASDFRQQGPPTSNSVAPGATVEVPYTFTPSAMGTRSATLTIGLEGATSLTVSFTGVGAQLSVSASPSPVDFGDVQLGTPAAVITVQLANSGNVAAQAQLGQIQGPQASLFGIAGGGGPLPAGGSLALPLSFLPVGPGPASASLAIQVCSADPAAQLGCTTLTLQLQGNAVDSQLTFNPDPVDFGAVPAGSSDTVQVTVQNPGTADVSLTSLSTASGSQAVFALQGLPSFPADLPPGQSLTVTVKYTPSGAAAGDSDTLVASYLASGTLSRRANDPLVGNGILTPCTLVLSPTSLAFGTVNVGTPAQAQLGLTNSGETACTVGAIAIAPGSDPAFTVDPATPATLSIPPGGSGSLTVDFLVATAVPPLARKGTLAFQSTDPSQPNLSVPLTATLSNQGFPCALTVTPTSLDWGTVAAATPTTLSVQVTDSGNGLCQVSGIQLSAAGSADFTLPSNAAFNLNPGQSNSIAVVFDAPNNNAPNLLKGDLLFASNDPTQPSLDVPLTARTQPITPYSPGWPKWHNDNTDQGLSTADTSKLVGTVKWKFQMAAPTGFGDGYLNSPVIDAKGNVYQLGMDGTFYEISPTGTQVWGTMLQSPSGDPHPATPIISKDGTLFISGGEGGILYHVSAAGTILDQAPTASGADGYDVCPSLTNGGLLMDGDDEGPCEVFSPSSLTTTVNSLNINFGFPDAERVGLAVGPDDTSYWCAVNSVFAVTPPGAGGFQFSSIWTAAGVQAAPDFPNTAAINAGGGGAMTDLALDTNHSGNLIVAVGYSPNYTNGQVEVSSIDPKTGAVGWHTLLPSGTLPTGFSIVGADIGNASPAIGADGTIYVGNVDGLYALDGATGAVKSGFPFKCADADSAPAIGGDGTIFFGCADGTFYAVNPNGTQRFAYKAAARISSSPAIGPDGTVVFVADDGNLYALK
ncbi:MAG: choice-of-anchor D domain-containing protein [Myxococcales bacterium]